MRRYRTGHTTVAMTDRWRKKGINFIKVEGVIFMKKRCMDRAYLGSFRLQMRVPEQAVWERGNLTTFPDAKALNPDQYLNDASCCRLRLEWPRHSCSNAPAARESIKQHNSLPLITDYNCRIVQIQSWITPKNQHQRATPEQDPA